MFFGYRADDRVGRCEPLNPKTLKLSDPGASNRPAYPRAAQEAVHALVKESNMELSAFHLGPLKDPVRVHEKAMDDYADRFPDDLPEACVADIIRSKVRTVPRTISTPPGLTTML